MNAALTPSLISLLITLIVVYRFARRELKTRTVTLSSLWIRPAIMIVLTTFLVFESTSADPTGDMEMFAALAGGSILGVIVGLLIVRNTHFGPAGIPNAVRVNGNRITFGIWVAALALRLLARFVLPHGADPRSQLPLNCGTVAMTAVAFIIISIAFAIEIRRYAGVAAPADSIVAPE